MTLRNRVIRSAAFENMAYGNCPSQDLYDYHTAVARGGVGTYFLEEAKRFRAALHLPLIYVGGMVSLDKMEEVLSEGFSAVQVARALIHDTEFVNKLHRGEIVRSGCGHSNYCIGRMYTLEMKCNHCVADLPASLRKEVEKAEQRWKAE